MHCSNQLDKSVFKGSLVTLSSDMRSFFLSFFLQYVARGVSFGPGIRLVGPRAPPRETLSGEVERALCVN